jgi:hypothetical protein
VPTFQQFSLAINTRRGYNTSHNIYLRFCQLIGLDPLTPASEHELCMLLVYYCRTHKVTTLTTFLSGVANYYKLNHMPLRREAKFQSVRRGLTNYLGLSQHNSPKAALTWSQLTRLVDHLQPPPSTNSPTRSFDSIRDTCLYVFCFFGLFRAKEVLGDHFRWSHVKQFDWGIEVTVPFSKTCNQPTSVRMVRRDDPYCPVLAFEAYRSATPAPLRSASLPFFRSTIDRSTPLAYPEALSTLKHRIGSLFAIDSVGYGWHSFRRGGATALFQAAVPDSLIALQGRWSSLTYRRYFDNNHHHTIPTSLLLKHTRQTSSEVSRS